MRYNKVLMLSLVTVLMLVVAVSAFAHGVWVENRLDKWTLVLGEGYKDNAYDPAMLTSVKAYDAKYKKASIETVEHSDHVTFVPADNAAVVAVEFDYGYWSQDPASKKFVNKPMTELPGSSVGTFAIKYSVSYLGSVDKVQALPDIPYQLIPQTDPTKLSVGDKLKVQLVHNGAGMADVDVILDVANNHTVTAKTDAKGFITVPVMNGAINVIGVELAMPYDRADKKASRMKVFTSLSFTLYPEEAE